MLSSNMCLPSCQCFGHWGRHPISYGSNCVNVESPRCEEGIYVSGKMVAIGETKHPRSEERAESTRILASKRNLYVSLRSGSAPCNALGSFRGCTPADSLMTFPEVSFFSGTSSPVFRKFFPFLEFL
ncbi:hypothetical protein VNO77_04322 [Canavalia gladiata]|uniref:Uncharacterized protein n=1 Tax=Canavalia gladiata TaxID=3824 RepID=A0AAN9MYD2_CANGL